MDPLASGEIQCQVGDEVFSSDDHKLGKVVAYDPRFLTVEHGLLRKGEYFIPMAAVNSCANRQIYLNVTKDDVEARGWDAPPSLPTDAGEAPLPR
jgi:hypothetical protein